MSRMTKYLKQTCQIEPYKQDAEGQPEHNRFGELIYKPAVTCKCRRESVLKDVRTENGSFLKSNARYFFDETTDIKINYKIDGSVVLSVEEYTNERGECEGFEVHVYAAQGFLSN